MANKFGGPLIAYYINALYRSPETKVKPDPDHLVQKTKEIFINAGLDELDHLQFRETELKKHCLNQLWKILGKLNPSRPRFQPEPDPDTENYDWSEPPLIEPKISGERLEAEIASWYVRSRLKTHKKRSETLYKIKSEYNNSPANPGHKAKPPLAGSKGLNTREA